MKISDVAVYGLHLRTHQVFICKKSVITGQKIAGKILPMLEDIAAKININTISCLKKFRC